MSFWRLKFLLLLKLFLIFFNLLFLFHRRCWKWFWFPFNLSGRSIIIVLDRRQLQCGMSFWSLYVCFLWHIFIILWVFVHFAWTNECPRLHTSFGNDLSKLLRAHITKLLALFLLILLIFLLYNLLINFGLASNYVKLHFKLFFQKNLFKLIRMLSL